MAFNFLFLISTILAECLICRPLSYRWDLDIMGASCGDEQALTMYTGGLNLLQDVIVVFMPMPIIWGLQMAPHKKLGVMCIFGIGITGKVLTVTSAMESIAARLSLLSLSHGSGSWDWFSSRTEKEYGQ
ncbi:MAG: hypothetical protein Q9218_002754 [Villophora microphyllina]